MLQALGEDFGRTEFPDGNSQTLSVGDRIVGHRLNVGREDFRVFGIYDFSGDVHRDRGLLSSQLLQT